MTQITGVVVPSLGNRPDFLESTLKSIRSSGSVYILLVAPREFDYKNLISRGLVDEFVEDPKKGLPEAINLGVTRLPKYIKYINWLGDDDLLKPMSMNHCQRILEGDPSITFVYGKCEYINERNEVLWVNRSGTWAKTLLRFGPDMVPQPGALIRRNSFNLVGGLNSKYKLAFDLDLFIKLTKLGPARYTPVTLSNFRWHLGSLSVADRRSGVSEASVVRLSHLPSLLVPIANLWEIPVQFATFLAGKAMTSRSARKKFT